MYAWNDLCHLSGSYRLIYSCRLSSQRIWHSRRKSREKQLRTRKLPDRAVRSVLQSFIKKFPSDNMDQISSISSAGTFLYPISALLHFSQFSSRKHNRQRKCRCICDRSCIHHSINSHKQREDNDQWQKKNHLSCQRHYNTQLRHTDRSKETGRYRLDTVCKGHKHKYFQITFCKLKIQLTSCSEDTHDLVWKYLETEKEYHVQLLYRQLQNNGMPVLLCHISLLRS